MKDIEQSVKDLLNDPGFYKEDKITAQRALSEAREGWQQVVHSGVLVDFRARNRCGGMVRGCARVKLAEDADGNCSIVSTTIES